MKNKFPKLTFVALLAFAFAPALASAHRPRLVESTQMTVTNPEVSKAYYGELSGEPHIYRINASEPFDLYVNVLVPDIEGQKKDVSALVIKNGDTAHPLATLDGLNFKWKQFFEPFGHDTYWMGPEYKARAETGEYEIRVWSSNNDSKYSLAIGEIEAFDFKEGVNVLKLIPKIKQRFFNESPVNFILSPFGWGYILIMYIFAFIAGLLYRAILGKVAKNSPPGVSKNIDTPDRLLRVGIGVGLLIWAIPPPGTQSSFSSPALHSLK